MSVKKVVGSIVFVLGVILICGSIYIKNEVEKGKGQVSSAQKQVDQGKGITSLSPYTKGVGDMFTGSIQKKIDEGKAEIAEYESLANWLMIGGIILAILGPCIIFIGKKR